MTTDGLRDDLARAIHEHTCPRIELYGSACGNGPGTQERAAADAVLPVVEAAVTTATETLRARVAGYENEFGQAMRTLVSDQGEALAAARGEVAAARTEGFNEAINAVLALPWNTRRTEIAAMRRGGTDA